MKIPEFENVEDFDSAPGREKEIAPHLLEKTEKLSNKRMLIFLVTCCLSLYGSMPPSIVETLRKK
ncbi:MAG TPA: hypothetical protein VLH19_02435 [Patescibacteria group bacterium]|nr:hypothetical protein [Patescibacteria group bacterium]